MLTTPLGNSQGEASEIRNMILVGTTLSSAQRYSEATSDLAHLQTRTCREACMKLQVRADQ